MASGRDPGLQDGGQLVADEGERRVVQRDADVAASARRGALVQRRDDAECGPDTGADVDHGRADADARPVRLARDADQAGERLHQRVVARLVGERPRLPERAHRAVDEPLVSRSQRLAAEPEALGGARAQRLHEHVGSVDEPQQRLTALLVLEVERERPLGAVGREEHHAPALEEARPPRAGLVAPGRMLHLHHVGAEAAEDLGAGGAGERGRDVDDPDAGERREAHGEPNGA